MKSKFQTIGIIINKSLIDTKKDMAKPIDLFFQFWVNIIERELKILKKCQINFKDRFLPAPHTPEK